MKFLQAHLRKYSGYSFARRYESWMATYYSVAKLLDVPPARYESLIVSNNARFHHASIVPWTSRGFLLINYRDESCTVPKINQVGVKDSSASETSESEREREREEVRTSGPGFIHPVYVGDVYIGPILSYQTRRPKRILR